MKLICMYKVSQKKWDLLLIIVAVNPTFFWGHLVVYIRTQYIISLFYWNILHMI